jgi:hypothetical protein
MNRLQVKSLTLAALAALALLSSGCSGAEPDELPFTQEMPGKSRALTFELSADSLSEGLNTLELEVLEDGNPVQVESIMVETHMPDMGHHGVQAEVLPTERGYEAEVVFSMPGRWLVDVVVEGEVSDSCQFVLEVQ